MWLETGPSRSHVRDAKMEELQIWKLLKNAIFKTKLSQPEGWLWMAFASASCIFLGNKKMRNHEELAQDMFSSYLNLA
jgi:hypothetical protein